MRRFVSVALGLSLGALGSVIAGEEQPGGIPNIAAPSVSPGAMETGKIAKAATPAAVLQEMMLTTGAVRIAAGGGWKKDLTSGSWLAMGTFMSVTVPSAEAARLDEYAAAAQAACRELEEQMSVFKPDGDIGRLNRLAGTGVVTVSAHTMAVLQEAKRYAEASGGTFETDHRAHRPALGIQPGPDTGAASGRGDDLEHARAGRLPAPDPGQQDRGTGPARHELGPRRHRQGVCPGRVL